MRTSDRTIPGPISCSADVLPFDFTFNLRAQQIFQYYRLKSSILSQQRFDTMLRRRPCERPVDNPRSWWVYAISCVMSRPNSRPWEDVLPIVQSRERYIELVKKKNSKSSGSNGYHSGLSSKESDELLMLEDLLPIEALMAFHKIALRKVYAAKQRKDSSHDSKPVTPKKESHEKSKSILAGRFRLPRLSTVSNRRKIQLDADVGEVLPSSLDDLAEEDEQLPTSLTTSAPSLLESMNLRLGRKVWFVDWKLHDAVVYLHLHHESDSASAVQIVLRADGNARSFGIGKRDFLFDVTQFDVLHRDDKVLFVSPFDDDSLAEEDPALMCSVVRSREGSKCQGPDMNMPSTFLELPPPGSVCRIVAGKNVDSFKLSMSAHPATLVWTTSLLKGLSDFIAVHCADPDYDLTAHIRNAATPLARKAQLTLLSPASMSLHLNIAAPKVWIPLVSSDKEGTLFIDAGTIKFASIKKEGETDADWELHARDIGVTFVRGINPTKMGREGHSHFRTYGVPYAPTGKIETSVIKPLSIDAKSRRSNVVTGEKRHALPRARNSSFVESVRHNDISISPICLNLVDAEMLARSFGKWYALCLGRVKRRVLSGNASADVTGQKDERQNDSREAESIPQVDIPRVLSINIEKVEMALEGHSKKLSASNDDRSITSLDTLLESATTTRAYLVEVFRIALKRSYMHDAASTSLSVMDASIIRLKDVSTVPPLKSRREAIESEYCVLSRATKLQELNGSPSIGTARSKSSIPSPGIFRASLFHNRATHLDEVELDIDSVVLRVTPMTLKDCAKAFRRIAELAQLVTKEMERKVHEEGRKARRRDRLGKFVLRRCCREEP